MKSENEMEIVQIQDDALGKLLSHISKCEIIFPFFVFYNILSYERHFMYNMEEPHKKSFCGFVCTIARKFDSWFHISPLVYKFSFFCNKNIIFR